MLGAAGAQIFNTAHDVASPIIRGLVARPRRGHCGCRPTTAVALSNDGSAGAVQLRRRRLDVIVPLGDDDFLPLVETASARGRVHGAVSAQVGSVGLPFGLAYLVAIAGAAAASASPTASATTGTTRVLIGRH